MNDIIEVPPPYIHDVISWQNGSNTKSIARLDKLASSGWELITIYNGLAYFRRTNPDYIAFINRENEKMIKRKGKLV